MSEPDLSDYGAPYGDEYLDYGYEDYQQKERVKNADLQRVPRYGV